MNRRVSLGKYILTARGRGQGLSPPPNIFTLNATAGLHLVRSVGYGGHHFSAPNDKECNKKMTGQWLPTSTLWGSGSAEGKDLRVIRRL